ncbi:MAG: hypothetical protein ACOYB0_09635 [Polynucleobacter sp.]
MKLALFVILGLCAMLCGCDPAFGMNPMDYHHHHQELSKAWPFTASFSYQEDYSNYWKSPAEFEEDGGGDCEDFATDLMYYIGKPSSAVEILFHGDTVTHMIVEYHGLYLEPRRVGKYYSRKEFAIIDTWDWDAAMRKCTLAGQKSIK